MEISAMAFRERILERFVAIRHLKDLQAFRVWNGGLMGIKRGHGLWAKAEMWEYICMHQYGAGLEALQLAFSKWLAVCERRPSMRERPEMKQEGEMFLALQRLFQDGDYAALDSAAQDRIAGSRNACSSFFMREF